VLIGSYDGHLYALEAATGALAWKVQTEGPVHATASVVDGVAYIAGCDENFRGIRVSDGKQVLEVLSGAYTGASPAIAGGRAFYGTFDNEVLAVELASKKIVWRYQHPERKFPFYASAAVAKDRVVVGGRDKLVHCLDAATGKALWTFATKARIDASAAIAGGRVYAGSGDGTLYVIDLADGSRKGAFEAGAPISASPAIAGGRLVVGTQDGRIYCLG
jgi:outer membrane protein assembly factor BamB